MNEKTSSLMALLVTIKGAKAKSLKRTIMSYATGAIHADKDKLPASTQSRSASPVHAGMKGNSATDQTKSKAHS